MSEIGKKRGINNVFLACCLEAMYQEGKKRFPRLKNASRQDMIDDMGYQYVLEAHKPAVNGVIGMIINALANGQYEVLDVPNKNRLN